MQLLSQAGEKFKAWREERKTRAVEAADPAGVTVPLWLVNAAKFASWVATLSLMYFLWLYTLDIARDRAAALHLTHAGQWVGNVQFWFPYIAGFALVAFGIPYVAKIAIPTFMSLSWSGNFWPKLWALIIALSVSLVVIAGTFTVQGDTLMERDREGLVAVEGVQQGRAALQARIDARQQELSEMMNNRNAYLAQAASVGAAEWERSYVVQARQTSDPRLPMIERALGAARAADAVRADLISLREQLAQSTTVAAVQNEVVTERTGWIVSTLGWLEGVRAILLSLVMDIVALMMPWIALRLEQARARQLGLAGGIPHHPWMIEDKRGEASVADATPGEAARAVFEAGGTREEAEAAARSAAAVHTKREEMYDAETGERLTYRKGTWVKPPKRRGQPSPMQMPPGERLPDETGVAHDGGGRAGMEPATEQREDREATPPEATPELSPDEQDAVDELLAAAQDDSPESDEERHSAKQDEPAGLIGDEEPIEERIDHEKPREPETRPERLIAADVAAE